MPGEDFGVLTVSDLREVATGRLSGSRLLRRKNKPDLLQHLLSVADDSMLSDMRVRKRAREEEIELRRTRRRITINEDAPRRDGVDSYLQLPSQDNVDRCYREFYNATSAAQVRSVVCGVCARRLQEVEDSVEEAPLTALANRSRLRPVTPHAAHDLYDGCLLEPAGIRVLDDGTVLVNTCRTCRDDLEHASRQGPPRLSLANNLWIGRMPPELQDLTIPEQILVAPLFPRVFVFKLFMKGGYHSDPESLQRGMRGTVTTYEMNVQDMASMVTGGLLPQKPSILASVITITFVGVGPLPKKWLWKTFRVRRPVVLRALEFFRTAQRHYHDVEIDTDRLAALPEDDVPDELMDVIRQCSDAGLAAQESEGYVPEDEDGESGGADALEGRDEDAMDSIGEPDVIPMHITGGVDMDLTKLTANDLLMWGLTNLWNSGKEGGYAVRHGNTPVNDFGRPRPSRPGQACPPSPPGNFFERAFPCLFPYGMGGIEGDQLVPVDFKEHIQWALQYHDRRFSTHETFPFMAFGIHQRRQALGSARVQMRRRKFQSEALMLSTITEDLLRTAQAQEDAGQHATNEAIILLKRLVHGTSGRVQGTDASRVNIRGQIWSTCLASLWITINPSDLHDPIAQVFAGAEINLDAFEATMGPSPDARMHAIARDPFAAAKFFHFLIDTIIRTLFQVRRTPFSVKAGEGVFGQASAYIGSVESQGRGTLHLHMLLWLANTPRPDELRDMLKTEEFRVRVVAFIKANLRAYLPGLESVESVRAIPKEKEISYSRPPHPDSSTYRQDLQEMELRLARAQQVHTCKVRQCLRYDKNGVRSCKRRAPFEKADDDYVTATGQWSQKRLYAYMNGWVPAILVNARCNNDGKLLTNGADTKNITFYVSSYTGKKQGKNYNLSAVMANAFAYHQTHLNPEYVHDLREQQRLLLFRVVNAVNREQELAAPMVISYLMGWGDVKCSHSYVPLYWTSFMGRLCRAFPELRWRARSGSTNVGAESTDSGVGPELEREETVGQAAIQAQDVVINEEAMHAEEGNDTVTLDVGSHGTLIVKCQVTDYVLRGEELADYSLFAFIRDTYEAKIPPSERDGGAESTGQDRPGGRGRPRNERSRYVHNHPNAASKHRIVRTPGHNTLVNIIGRWFPRRDDNDTQDAYCAAMLMLLKLWRDILSDLKPEGTSWASALEGFEALASPNERMVLSRAQYFHECASAADGDRATGPSGRDGGHQDIADNEDDDPNGEWEDVDEDVEYTEAGLQALRVMQTSRAEQLNAIAALQAARTAGYFPDAEVATWDIRHAASVKVATASDFQKLESWKDHMDADIRELQVALDGHDTTSDGNAQQGSISTLAQQSRDAHVGDQAASGPEVVAVEGALEPVALEELRPAQFRAFDIIIWHLEQMLEGEHVPPLRMIIYGEGGTGKSRVIQTVTQAFNVRQCTFLLVKAAYTGIAASLIDGKTTHVIAHVKVNGKGKLSDESKRALQAFWNGKRYLLLDEYSMIAKCFLALLSRTITTAMEGSGLDTDASFGSISVILCGDLHQFPPVACSPREALYRPADSGNDTVEQALGRRLYEEFDKVVILDEQMRVTDPEWCTFLRSLRMGRVTREQIEMLRSLVLRSADRQEMSSSKWKNASLVTPRHAVRKDWNNAALRKFCAEKGERMFIIEADDRKKGQPLELRERYALAGRMNTGDRRRGKSRDLPDIIEVVKGMKVMVTSNLKTDLDIANGARGEIVDIILHPDEPPLPDQPVVKLKFLPTYILVKLDRTKTSPLPGLEEGVIPVEPISVSTTIHVSGKKGLVRRTVHRRQYPITAAYGFTDYRSQGQTIPIVIVDIKKPPPPGQLTLFNLYVALSRSRGRDSIRVLRDFEAELLMQQHDHALLEEDERLEKLNEETRKWWESLGRGRQGES